VICINIKGKRVFQGTEVRGGNKIRLDQNGRNCIGPYD